MFPDVRNLPYEQTEPFLPKKDAADLTEVFTSSSAIAERPCCRVGSLCPKVED